MLPWATYFVAPDGTSLPTFTSRFYDVVPGVLIYGNLAVGDDGGAVTMACVGDPTCQADQVAEGIVGALGGVTYTGLAVRGGAPGSGNGYWWLVSVLVGQAYFGTINGGALATLGTTGSPGVGDAMRLEAQGNQFRCYINNALDSTFVDGTYPSGYPGVSGFRNDHLSGLSYFRAYNLIPSGFYAPAFVGSP